MLSTTVEDTGCGIDDEKMTTLFQLYGGISTANEYNPQGMGLGLSLCKRLTKALGGEISVSSQVGVGCAFTFTIQHSVTDRVATQNESLPKIKEERSPTGVNQRIKILVPESSKMINMATALAKNRRNSIMVLPMPRCRCSQVLVVDDESINRFVIKSYLSSIEIDTDEAENGQVALEKVAKKAESTCCKGYKLIVMDINMPVMDGTTATGKLIESFEKDQSIKAPIITVTAANMQSKADIEALLSVGFVDIMQKPIRKDDFLKRVRPYFSVFPCK